MGVESIEVDTVTLRMVARTLPGKQFEAGRQLRVLVVRALARAGIVTAADAKIGVVDEGPLAASQRRAKRSRRPRCRCGSDEIDSQSSWKSDRRPERRWPGYMFGGRVRTSTLVLIVAFLALWWVYNDYRPARAVAPGPPSTQVVPPGFVPDPNYTWVPRSQVQEPPHVTVHADADAHRRHRRPPPQRPRRRRCCRRSCCRRRSVRPPAHDAAARSGQPPAPPKPPPLLPGLP